MLRFERDRICGIFSAQVTQLKLCGKGGCTPKAKSNDQDVTNNVSHAYSQKLLRKVLLRPAPLPISLHVERRRSGCAKV
jgi:hypothetical protein